MLLRLKIGVRARRSMVSVLHGFDDRHTDYNRCALQQLLPVLHRFFTAIEVAANEESVEPAAVEQTLVGCVVSAVGFLEVLREGVLLAVLECPVARLQVLVAVSETDVTEVFAPCHIRQTIGQIERLGIDSPGLFQDHRGPTDAQHTDNRFDGRFIRTGRKRRAEHVVLDLPREIIAFVVADFLLEVLRAEVPRQVCDPGHDRGREAFTVEFAFLSEISAEVFDDGRRHLPCVDLDLVDRRHRRFGGFLCICRKRHTQKNDGDDMCPHGFPPCCGEAPRRRILFELLFGSMKTQYIYILSTSAGKMCCR